MISNNNNYETILGGFSEKNVMVIGDLMLDAYFWGKAERISPEAPVPIIEVERKNFNPGGAGNVALNLAGLGCNVSIMSIVGNDVNGDIILKHLENENIDISSILIIDDFQTPIKTRVIAQDQQVVRIDQENNSNDILKYLSKLRNLLKINIEKVDGIILTDYNKGLLSIEIIKLILDLANQYSIPVYVDPKWDNFFEYKNVRLFKPNISEFRKAVGNSYPDKNLTEQGIAIREKMNSEILLVTKGAKGADIFTKNNFNSLPTESQSVHDVSGAGDTVISTFTLADLNGATVMEAASIANIAAGIVCAKVGVVPIAYSELYVKLLS